MRSLRTTAGVMLIALALAPGAARAHGREPSLGLVAFDPTDPDHVVVRTTWGFITTHDHGETFTWQCAAGVPFDRTREDPSLAATRSGAMLASTFDGLFRSDPNQCAWSAPETAPQGAFVTDVVTDPTDLDVAYAIVSPGATPDAIHRSDDEGLTWSEIAQPHPDALTDRVRVAPSDAARLYTSGVIPRSDTAPRIGVVLRSDDRGATWRSFEIPLVDTERTIHLLGVDPTSPDRVFARVLRPVADTTPERLLLSEDGGETWVSVLEILEIVGFAIASDGVTAWAGSWDGGLHRSVDGGRTWSVLDAELRVRCLAWREAATAPGELWVCADGFTRGFALGLSEDRGDTIAPLWIYWDVVNDVGCDPTTPVGQLCPMYWPDLATDLQLDGAVAPDGGVPSEMDGGVAPVDRPGGCGCATAGAGAGPGAVLVPILALLAYARRRRS